MNDKMPGTLWWSPLVVPGDKFIRATTMGQHIREREVAHIECRLGGMLIDYVESIVIDRIAIQHPSEWVVHGVRVGPVGTHEQRIPDNLIRTDTDGRFVSPVDLKHGESILVVAEYVGDCLDGRVFDAVIIGHPEVAAEPTKPAA